MTAEYELTKEDWSAFNFYHHFHSPTARRQRHFVPGLAVSGDTLPMTVDHAGEFAGELLTVAALQVKTKP